MAKDDYFVLVYNLLAYLYKQLKSGKKADPKAFEPDQGVFLYIPIEYRNVILINLLERGLIDGIQVSTNICGDTSFGDLSQCYITHEGIQYLFENNMLKKAQRFFKDIKEMTPFV